MPLLESNPSAPEKRSLLDTRQLSAKDILSLFRHADELEQLGERYGCFYDPKANPGRVSKVVGLLFFEASTRTRMSFQTAAYRLGHQALAMELGSSSLSKGESYVDTVLNIAAMQPDTLVVRYGAVPALDEVLPKLPMPVINAGSGTLAHPTQGLLDAYTIFGERASQGEGVGQTLAGQRVLIVGDIVHSRVASSNIDVLTKLGAEIGICGPASLLPRESDMPNVRFFFDLDEALKWPTVYMGLRIQLERHSALELKLGSLDEYHERFGLSRERLKKLAKDVMIMHPGPINHGVEFSDEVIKDPRSRVLDQVTNGVLIRAALLNRALGGNG